MPFAVRSKHPDDAIRQLLLAYLLEQHLVRRIAFPRMEIRPAAKTVLPEIPFRRCEMKNTDTGQEE